MWKREGGVITETETTCQCVYSFMAFKNKIWITFHPILASGERFDFRDDQFLICFSTFGMSRYVSYRNSRKEHMYIDDRI